MSDAKELKKLFEDIKRKMAKLKPWQKTNKIPLNKENSMKIFKNKESKMKVPKSKKPEIGSTVIKNINNMLWYLDLQYFEFHSYKILERVKKSNRKQWERLYYFPNEKSLKYRTSSEIRYGYSLPKDNIISSHPWEAVEFYEEALPLDKEILETIKYILLDRCKQKAKEERAMTAAREEREEINNYLKARGITNE